MANVKIIETGAMRSLGIIDTKSKGDDLNALLRSHGVRADEDGICRLSAGDYNKWQVIFADLRWVAIRENCRDSEERTLWFKGSDAIDCDLESYPRLLNEICDEWEKITSEAILIDGDATEADEFCDYCNAIDGITAEVNSNSGNHLIQTDETNDLKNRLWDRYCNQ